MNKIEFPILYKRSNLKDKINQWQIIVEGDSHYTISGYVGGKLFEGDKTVCTPKNTGKKNSTTADEQALEEAKSLWKKRKDLGYWEDIHMCDKKVFYQPMLSHEYKDRLSKNKIKFPVGSSVKLDGVRCVITSDGMNSRNGKPITSAPHIFDGIKHLFDIYPDLVLDGELYADKNICDFNTIISCVRKTKPTLEDLIISEQYISYYIYDIPNINGEHLTYKQRIEKLKHIIEGLNNPKFVFVGYEIVNNHDEVKNKLTEYIELGYEGQMIRVLDSYYENKRSNNLLKHKTFYDAEFDIIGYSGGVGKFENKLATLKVNVDGVEVDCTVNGTMEYLTELFKIKETLIGKKATVKYFEKTTDGSLRFPKVINIDRWDL